ncbi:50S ribosomal protein L15 [candidate division WOR-3 bacterium JGI_Cruoil_03_44_89]|uniref:Large ribosomal subunit protein uL15 n=1 Tax=candidate division WOR-3 bacterium JGI_Cruoil_03_44_89 TaxID=1973748 RepID=A0A235BV92_UNCW3|nr:MAG: 50S ribosomal protein L15 [candidate division WOR-3 bacterium JGI_Cruoil_03_44_89]
MAELHNLKKIKGKPRKRRGRGASSGVGGTSGRGHKGAGARAGKKISPWFEGGQTPLYRRLPKRGFHSPSPVDYEVVNVKELNKFEDGTVVNEELLRTSGLVKRKNPIKILGDGELTKKLTVEGLKVSTSAKEKVEARGGKVQ